MAATSFSAGDGLVLVLAVSEAAEVVSIRSGAQEGHRIRIGGNTVPVAPPKRAGGWRRGEGL
jgi:hypothetical protein